MKAPTHFVASLHGLRGLAALYVLLSHISVAGFVLIPHVSFLHIGKVGVVMFFVLSAYLLTSRLESELRERPEWRFVTAYFVNRFFRIYPIFLVVLLIHLAMGLMGSADVFRHLILMAGRYELWAIPVEFRYYLVIPCIVLGSLLIGKARMTALLIALTAAAFVYGLWQPKLLFQDSIALIPYLLPFLVGSLLAILLSGQASHGLAPGRWLGVPCLAALILATLAFKHLHGAGHAALWKPVLLLTFSLAAGGVIVASLGSDLVSHVLAQRVMVFFGEISFSLYLLHMLVIGVLFRHRVLPPGMPAWVAVGTSILLAWISYRFIEKPGMRLGHRLAQRIRSGAPMVET